MPNSKNDILSKKIESKLRCENLFQCFRTQAKHFSFWLFWPLSLSLQMNICKYLKRKLCAVWMVFESLIHYQSISRLRHLNKLNWNISDFHPNGSQSKPLKRYSFFNYSDHYDVLCIAFIVIHNFNRIREVMGQEMMWIIMLKCFLIESNRFVFLDWNETNIKGI